MAIKKVRAPVRIDFGGGTTDVQPFPKKHGGAILNAGITPYIFGKLIAENKKVSLEYHGNVPTSSGLGTSGVMNLVWLALISKEKDKFKLAERVYDLEQVMGLVGGRQDQYAAAFGGINFLEFKGDKVKFSRVRIKKEVVKKLEDSLVLIYTGKPHFSGNTNSKMIENLKKGKNTKNLLKIKGIAYKMKKCLEKGDLERFAELMNEETIERSKLDRAIVPKKVQEIIKRGFKNGAISAKVCGSGGGGCLLFFGDKKKLKKYFGRKVIDFKFDFDGLKWL